MPAPFAARRMYPRKPPHLTPQQFAALVGTVDASSYDPSDTSRVFSDTAGTTPAVVDGVVRCVNDGISARPITIPTASAEPILRQVNGLYYLDFDATDDRMYSAADWTIQAPQLIVSVFSKAVEDSLNYAGATLDGSNYHRIMGTTTNRVQGAARDTDTAATGALSAVQTMPLDTVRVVSTLLLPGYQDVMVNDFKPGVLANAWVDATASTGRLTINTNGSTPTTSVAHAQKCYYFGAFRGGAMSSDLNGSFHKMRIGLHRFLALKAGIIL